MVYSSYPFVCSHQHLARALGPQFHISGQLVCHFKERWSLGYLRCDTCGGVRTGGRMRSHAVLTLGQAGHGVPRVRRATTHQTVSSQHLNPMPPPNQPHPTPSDQPPIRQPCHMLPFLNVGKHSQPHSHAIRFWHTKNLLIITDNISDIKSSNKISFFLTI